MKSFAYTVLQLTLELKITFEWTRKVSKSGQRAWIKKYPREFGWIQELSIRRTIPMSTEDYRNLDPEKKVVWLSYLEGEQLRQQKETKEASNRMKSKGRKGRRH